MFKTNLFDPAIEPSCSYCEYGTPTKDGQSILCEKRGVMLLSDSCRKFVYDPLSRKPGRQRKLPSYDPGDFTL